MRPPVGRRPDPSRRASSSRERVNQLRAQRRRANRRWLPSLRWRWLLALVPIVLLLWVIQSFRNDPAASAPQPTVPVATPTAQIRPAYTGPTAVPGSVSRIPILMYHYIREVDPSADPVGYNLSVTPAQFATQLDWLASQGYTPVRMDEALRCLQGESGCPDRPVALTFDDGYADAYDNALPLLQMRGFVATFYIVSDFVGQPGYMGPDQLRALHTAGMELGAHSLNHLDLTTLSRDDAYTQIADSGRQIADLVGVPIISFCYPAGQFNDETRALVQEAGYTNAVTTIQSEDFSDPYTLPRLRIDSSIDLAGFEWLVQSSSP